ncbi:MAG: hypothetical protein ACOH2M_10015 [Cypionkella sp.]
MTLRRPLLSSVAALGLLLAANAAMAQAPAAASPQTIQADARSNLSGGLRDAAEAASNMALEYSVAPPPGFFDPEALVAMPTTQEEAQAYAARIRDNPPRYGPLSLANTDMAISNGKLFVGNFNGFNAYDISEGEPKLVMSVVCPGGQGDVSVHGNLLFMSVEQNRARLDCGTTAAEGDVNAERFRGIRIFDISDLNAPRQIAAVQTCRGSHTHTLVPDPSDANVLYIYNSATSGVRKTDELGICTDGQPDANPETALYSIDVIKVPLRPPRSSTARESSPTARRAASPACGKAGAQACLASVRPRPTTATTSPSIPNWVWRRAPAAATAYCWTSPIPRTRPGFRSCSIPTWPIGTRQTSTMPGIRLSSPTNGVAAPARVVVQKTLPTGEPIWLPA